MARYLGVLLAAWTLLTSPGSRDERGGTGGTVETLLLVAGAVIVAGLVVAGIRVFVMSHMP